MSSSGSEMKIYIDIYIYIFFFFFFWGEGAFLLPFALNCPPPPMIPG